MPHDVNPATFPTISVEQGVLDWNHEISGAGAQQIVLTLAENLELENQALLAQGCDDPRGRRPRRPARGDAGPARATPQANGTTVIERYQIDDVNVTLLVPFGRQDGLSLGPRVPRHRHRGDLRRRPGTCRRSASSPFATTFVLRRATGGRWLNVAELPLADGN